MTAMKNRVQQYLPIPDQATYDYRIWNVITEGDYVFKNEEGDDIPIGKLPETDAKLAQLNFKTKNFFYCAVNDEEYNRICGCKMAKEMWEKLQVTYEGTTQVKKSKIYMLVKEYEMFKMEEGEIITAMFTHFTLITNGLKALGKEYSMEDNVQKVLCTLPASWHAKSTTIEEAKDLSKVTLDKLIGSLMTYEIKKKNATTEAEAPK
ncbi:uncharacterized protein LOC131167594 [Malania oleifera]|uniref:uncharacterized protein LOC131167594 n=1 Tax=Malania oleifera TaxID=397392 RepID=UPI0025ADF99C|nr:uncharacterized protein LOC131167594 [Malania oleifera]